jgi:hypothetical protein
MSTARARDIWFGKKAVVRGCTQCKLGCRWKETSEEERGEGRYRDRYIIGMKNV